LVFIAKLTVRSTCFGHQYAHHQELKIYTDGCCLWYLALWFTGHWSGVELWVMPVCGMLQSSIPQTGIPNSHLHRLIIPEDVLIQFDLLMMSAATLETCSDMK